MTTTGQVIILSSVLGATAVAACVAGVVAPRRKLLFVAMTTIHALAAFAFWFATAESGGSWLLYATGINVLMVCLWLGAAALMRVMSRRKAASAA
jgi:hypothetical protein